MITVIKKPTHQPSWEAFQWRTGLYVAELPHWFFEAFTTRRLCVVHGKLCIFEGSAGHLPLVYGDYLVNQGTVVRYTERDFWDEFQRFPDV